MEHLSYLKSFVPFEPGILAVVETGESVGDNLERLRALANTDNITGVYMIGSDVHNTTVNSNVAMKHELTGSCTGGSYAKTVYDVVEA